MLESHKKCFGRSNFLIQRVRRKANWFSSQNVKVSYQ
uniref:Uncharacterized protein n=1 Tax=Rhizophora mucronata TaxID=61149 RepID=A0A2P2N1B3_RHIMU